MMGATKAPLVAGVQASGIAFSSIGRGEYYDLGYCPADKIWESVSRTQEYAYDDWAMATMADSSLRRFALSTAHWRWRAARRAARRSLAATLRVPARMGRVVAWTRAMSSAFVRTQ